MPFQRTKVILFSNGNLHLCSLWLKWFTFVVAVKIYAALNDNLITEDSNGGQYGFFIHPGETVHLPFKFQSFSAATQLEDGDSLKTSCQTCEKKIIKVGCAI